MPTPSNNAEILAAAEHGWKICPVKALEEIKAEVAKLAARRSRAAARGAASAAAVRPLDELLAELLEIGPEFEHRYVKQVQVDTDSFGQPIFDSVDVVTRACAIRLVNSVPVVDGFELRAIADFGEDDNGKRVVFLTAINGAEVPAGARAQVEADWTCDFCCTNRRRLQLFLVVGPPSERFPRGWGWIGGSCMKDYFGDAFQSAALKLAWIQDLVLLLNEKCGEASFGGGGAGRAVRTLTFLSWVCMAARVSKGFLSRGRAREHGGVATADLAKDSLEAFQGRFKNPQGWTEAKKMGMEEPSEADMAAAVEARGWAVGLSDEDVEVNDYLSNLRASCRSTHLLARAFGVVTSVLAAVERWRSTKLRQEKEDLLRDSSKYLGPIGTKLDWTKATVLHRATKDGEWDMTVILSFLVEAPTGPALAVWFAGATFATVPLVAGWQGWIRGTVKNTGLWQGIQQTQLTRCICLTDAQRAELEAEQAAEEARKLAEKLAKKAERDAEKAAAKAARDAQKAEEKAKLAMEKAAAKEAMVAAKSKAAAITEPTT
jgi:hypothetical protein